MATHAAPLGLENAPNVPVYKQVAPLALPDEEEAFARLPHDRLQGPGICCWLDEHQLLPGDDLHEGIGVARVREKNLSGSSEFNVEFRPLRA